MITVVVAEDRNWTVTICAYASQLAAEDSVIALAQTAIGLTDTATPDADLTYDDALDILSGRGWDLTVEDVEVQP